MEALFFNDVIKIVPLNWELLCVVLISAVFHATVYFVISPFLSGLFKTYGDALDKQKRAGWDSRVVSNVHAIVTFFSALCCFYVESTYQDYSMTKTSNFGFVVIAYTLGYFIYDFLLVLYHYPHLGGIEMVYHHFAGVFTATFMILVGGKTSVCAFIGLLGEVSTPFVNQRWFFSESGMSSSSLNVLNGILMWLGFLFRVFTFLYYYPCVFYYQHQVILTFPRFWMLFAYLQYFLLGFLNCLWFYKISKGILKVLTKGKNEKSN